VDVEKYETSKNFTKTEKKVCGDTHLSNLSLSPCGKATLKNFGIRIQNWATFRTCMSWWKRNGNNILYKSEVTKNFSK
jgi:hypothetical protein